MTIHFLQNSFSRNKEYQSALSYNRDIGPSLEEICKPLFENFNIKMFTYSRIFKNGRRVYVSTNSKWVEHYISNSHQDEINHLEHYIPANDIKYALWDSYKMDRVFYSAYNNFNLWHGFSIYEHKKDYVDFFDFAADRSNDQIVNFYINNYALLDHFTRYFKSKSVDLINFSDENIWITPKVWIPFNEIPKTGTIDPDKLSDFDAQVGITEKKIYHFKPSLKISKNHVNDCKIISLSEVKYTEKESQCMTNLVGGKTPKEIANVLDVSSKDIESYIKSVKRKTRVLPNSDFIKFYENNLISAKEISHNTSNSIANKCK